MSLKDLAKQAGIKTDAKNETPAPAAEASAAAPPAAEAVAAATTDNNTKKVSDLLKGAKGKKKEGATTPKKEKKPAEPKIHVDDAWIQSLAVRANEQFGTKFGATIAFTVAKSRGRFVSLTPKLVYPDGTVKSAGPKNRVGFCTNEKWDDWNTKLGAALESAHSAERRAPKSRKTTGQWASFSAAVKDSMGEDIVTKSVAKRLVIKDASGNRVTLKRKDDNAHVGNATGSPEFISTVLRSVATSKFEEKKA